MTMLRRTGRLGHSLAASVLASRSGILAPSTARVYARTISTDPEDIRSPAPRPKHRTTSSGHLREGEDVTFVPRRKFLRIPEYKINDDFARRHIGPDDQSVEVMLGELDPPAQSLDGFVREVIPPDVLSHPQLFPGRNAKGSEMLLPARHLKATGNGRFYRSRSKPPTRTCSERT